MLRIPPQMSDILVKIASFVQHVSNKKKMFPTILCYEKSWKRQAQVIHFRVHSRN